MNVVKDHFQQFIDEVEHVAIDLACCGKANMLAVPAIFRACDLSEKLQQLSFDEYMDDIESSMSKYDLDFKLRLMLSKIELFDNTYEKYGEKVKQLFDSEALEDQAIDRLQHQISRYEELVLLYQKYDKLRADAQEHLKKNRLCAIFSGGAFKTMTKAEVIDCIRSLDIVQQQIVNEKQSLLVAIVNSNEFFKIRDNVFSEVSTHLKDLSSRISNRMLGYDGGKYISLQKLNCLYDLVADKLFKNCSREDWNALWNMFTPSAEIKIKWRGKGKTLFLIRSLVELNLNDSSASIKEKWLTKILDVLDIDRNDYNDHNGSIDESDSSGNTDKNMEFILLLEKVIKVKRNKRRGKT